MFFNTVNSCLFGFNWLVRRLEKVVKQEEQRAKDLRLEAALLHKAADYHEDEATRGYRIIKRLKEFVS